MQYVYPARAILSTFFVAEVASSNLSTSVTDFTGNAMGLTSYSSLAKRTSTIASLLSDPHQWAMCSLNRVSVGQLLPCRSGDKPERCIDGARMCGSTVYANMLNPFLELDLTKDVPANALDERAYFFAVEFKLPVEQDYARLLFEGAQAYEGVVSRGYELTIRDAHHIPLRVQCEPWTSQSVQSWTEGLRYVQHRCAKVLATDSDLVELSKVRYVTFTLPGAMRMIWLEDIVLLWRTIDEFPPRPPPSPSLPTLPSAPPAPGAPPFAPDPSPPPVSTHTWFPNKALDSSILIIDVALEPCQLTEEKCGHHLYERRLTDAAFTVFELSESGCCYLYKPFNDTNTVKTALQGLSVTRGGVSGVGVV